MSDCKLRHKVRNNKKAIREKLIKIKRHEKCFYCGEEHPACLEFHHLITEQKETEICNMLSKYTEEEIMEEVKKCIVVCSNCHKKLHWRENETK